MPGPYRWPPFCKLTHNNHIKSVSAMEGESGRTRGWGGTRGGALCRRFGRRNKSTKNKREGDGAVALDGRRLTVGHNNQPNSVSGVGEISGKARDCGGTYGGAVLAVFGAPN